MGNYCWNPDTGTFVPALTVQLGGHKTYDIGSGRHVLWSNAGVLCALELTTGSALFTKDSVNPPTFELEIDGAQYDLGSTPKCLTIPSVRLCVQSLPDGCVVMLDGALAQVASQLAATQVIADCPSAPERLVFQLDEKPTWSARTALPASVLASARELRVGRSSDAAITLSAEWCWDARFMGFAADRNGLVEERTSLFSPSPPRGPAYVILEGPAPPGAVLLTSTTRWVLGPAILRADGHYAYQLLESSDESDASVTLEGLLQVLVQCAGGFTLAATSFAACRQIVYVADRVRVSSDRYCAIIRGGSFEPSIDEALASLQFGPALPLFLTDCPGTTEYRVIQATPKPRIVGSTEFRFGALPRSIRASAPGHLFCESTTKPTSAYGVLSSAFRLAASGRWKPVSAIEQSGVVAFQGLVDRTDILTVVWEGRELLALSFVEGFPLNGQFWVAAPFGGVAMPASASWWALLSDPLNSQLRHRQGHWYLDGNWLELTPGADECSATLKQGCKFRGPRLFSPFGVAKPGSRSVPILEVREQLAYPILRGVLADDSGLVELLGARRIRLGPANSHCRYEVQARSGAVSVGSGDGVDEAWPISVKAAAADARRSTRSYGSVEGASWEREEDGSITITVAEAQSIGPSAVHILVPD